MHLSFVNVESIPKYLHCPRCLGIFKKPHRLMCTHTFCKSCVLNSNLPKNQCPKCKKPFKPEQVIPDMIATHCINELPIRCSKKLCGWTGLYEHRKSHLCFMEKPQKALSLLSANTDQQLTGRKKPKHHDQAPIV